MEIIQWDGQQITKPGIYAGIPMQAEVDDEGNVTRLGYHHPDICDGPSLSSSILREAARTSMDEVWLKWPGNPDRDTEDADKPHFIKGRARHTLFLGEAGFARDFVVQPETYPEGVSYPAKVGTSDKKWTYAAKWCKDWREAQHAAGRSILPPDEMTDIKGAAAKLSQHPEIKDGGILNGLVEHSIFWRDPKTGIWLKARPDVIPTDSAMIVDYKGSKDVSYRALEKALDETGYHQQLALIGEGMAIVAGVAITDYVLVFQKWTAPYSVNVKPIAGEAVHYGAMLNRRSIDKIHNAIETGIWPGPDDDGVPLNLPAYRLKDLQYQAEKKLLPDPTLDW